MKLILHVGHPKCASSTVQSLLWANRAALESEGKHLVGAAFLLPQETSAWDWPVWFLNGSDVGFGERLAARKREYAGMGVETLILSAENLFDPARAAHLEKAFEVFDTSVIYYVRRQDEFLLSSWRQWAMKRGISVRQHILRRVAEGKPDYRGTLAYFSARLGRDRVHSAFLGSRFLNGRTVETDVWAAIGARGKPSIPAARSNVSPDRAILLFLAGQPHLFESPHDEAPVDALMRADPMPPRRLMLDRHTQRSLKTIYDPVDIGLARDFMDRGDGDTVIALDSTIEDDPFVLTAQDIGRIEVILPRVSDAALRAEFLKIFNRLDKRT